MSDQITPEEATAIAAVDQTIAHHSERLDHLLVKSRENADWPGSSGHAYQAEIMGSASAIHLLIDSECTALMLAIALNRLAQISTFTDPAASVAFPNRDVI